MRMLFFSFHIAHYCLLNVSRSHNMTNCKPKIAEIDYEMNQ